MRCSGRTVDEQTLSMLEKAQQHLFRVLESMRGESESAIVAQDAIVRTLPHVLGLIEERLPKGHAQIFTRRELRAIFAQFAVDLLSVQSGCVRDSIRARRRQARPLTQS